MKNILIDFCFVVAVGFMFSAGCPISSASEKEPFQVSAEKGYELLRTKPFLPADFDDDVFDELWKLWPEPLRSEAEQSTKTGRRKLAFSRYGLMPVTGAENPYQRALGYVDDGNGGWVMNCLVCHAGKVAGRQIPGLGNTRYDLQTLTEEVRLTKLRLRKKLTHMDLGSLSIPLSTNIGTTNSVVFGIALGALRDPDMTVNLKKQVPKLVHHDLDAPPWWNVKKKEKLYIDGFAPKNHRVLMQFILIPSNGRQKILEWKDDFRHILAYIESLKPPKYPFEIDSKLAQAGKRIFEANCAHCHGTYGESSFYEQKTINIDTIKTDPVRFNALAVEYRRSLKSSWMSYYGKDEVIIEPEGYAAPPLDGIWASAPYFHNGSVPTLWYVLNPKKRPSVWKRSGDGYDQKLIGLEIQTFGSVPNTITDKVELRRYFDTSKFGKSAAGHEFPDNLDEDEKRAVLEYLKTI